MRRLIPAALLLTFCCAAPAQSLYKCRIDGKTVYSGAPCAGARSTPIAVPPGPQATPSEPAAAQELLRQQKAAAKLEKERHAREDKARREEFAAGRAAAARRQRCDKLALERKYAEDAADKAAGFDKESLREKADRLRETVAIECKD